jgi:hypothetical protein
MSNAAGLEYGAVSVIIKVHNGRVTDITYSTTESTREAEKEIDTRRNYEHNN